MVLDSTNSQVTYVIINGVIKIGDMWKRSTITADAILPLLITHSPIEDITTIKSSDSNILIQDIMIP